MTAMVRALDPTGGLRWHNRFQVRLVGYLVLLSLASSVTAGYVYYSRQVEFVEAEQIKRGRTLISNLAGQSELGAYAGDRAFLTVPAQRALFEEDVNFVAIYSRRGRPLIRLAKPGIGFDVKLSRAEIDQLVRDAAPRTLTRHHADHDDLRAPIVSLDIDAEQALFGDGANNPSTTIGIARLGLSRRPAQRKLTEVLRWGTYLAAMILAMGLLLALFLSRRISRPILALARGADEVRRGSLGVQIDVNRSDELGLLALSFNRMSTNLKQTVESLAHLNRNLEQEVTRRTMALRRSRDFVTLLNAPLQLDRLLDTALDALLQIVAAPAGAAYVTGAKRRLELAVCHGIEPAALHRATAAASARLTPAAPPTRGELDKEDSAGGAPELVRCAGQRERAATVTLQDDELALLGAAAVARGTGMLLCIPLRYRERTEGVVVLLLDAPLPADQIEFIDHAASQLAIAVSNARAYAEAERLARELEQRNLVLLQQRDELQQVSRLKSEFLANVSHELRTPLNAIVGYAELVADGVYGPVNPEQEQGLGGIRESAASLLQLINEILDLSKVEAGRMTVSLDTIDLGRIVREVVEFSAPLVRDKPYDIGVSMPQPSVTVQTDGSKVRQILVNLLSNAIKFTDEGTVDVSVEPAADGGAKIAVCDTGIGMHPDDLKVIFDEFRQIDGSPTRRHGGTGLGLAICRKLAHLIGASLVVTSEPGQGSTFTLRVPGPAEVARLSQRLATQHQRPATGQQVAAKEVR